MEHKPLVPGKMQYIRKSEKDGGNWSYKTKMKVVATYLATGNLLLTSRLENVPSQTIQNWRKTDWWLEAINDMQLQEKVESNKTLKKIRDQALNVIADRLENGNFQYDAKTGRVERVPVNARDAHRIATDFIDKQSFIEDRITNLNREQETKTEDVLKKLMDTFAEMSKGQKKKADDIIDVEFTEVNEDKETK